MPALVNPYIFGGVQRTRWRLTVDEAYNGGLNASVSEWILAATNGGSNLLTGATISATQEASPDVAARAIDGNNATYWRTTGGPPESLTAILGSPITPVEMRLRTPPSGTPGRNDVPVSFVLQWSPDGTTWNTVLRHIRRYNWDAAQTKTIPLDMATDAELALGGATAPHRFWRVNATSVQGGQYFGLRELRGVFGGSALAINSDANWCFASASFSSAYLPHLMEDGNSGTYWSSPLYGGPHWAALGFSVPQRLDAIRMTVDAAAYGPTNFTIAYSDDGTTWTTTRTVTGAASWTTGETRDYNVT